MRETKETSLDAILEDVKLDEPAYESLKATGKPVTIWLSAEDKALYDQLQERTRGSGRRFSAIARDLLRVAMRRAVSRAG